MESVPTLPWPSVNNVQSLAGAKDQSQKRTQTHRQTFPKKRSSLARQHFLQARSQYRESSSQTLPLIWPPANAQQVGHAELLADDDVEQGEVQPHSFSAVDLLVVVDRGFIVQGGETSVTEKLFVKSKYLKSSFSAKEITLIRMW